MLLRAVAVRYADALVSLADKVGGFDELEKDLALVVSTVEGHEGLQHSLISPTVPGTKKHSILKGVFGGKVADTVLNFLYVLVDKNREEYLSTILEVYRERLREMRDELVCHVTSAEPLSKEIRKDLEKTLAAYSGKKVELVEVVDPNLLAGMVVTMGDRVVDTSFRHQLREVEAHLVRAG